MRAQDLPASTRFIFWCTAPFLILTLVLLPLLVRPPHPLGWVAVAGVELFAGSLLLGLYDPKRYWWCWRIFGGIVFLAYLVYVVGMIVQGQWFGDGRKGGTNALNALIGLIVFGYPGFMYAVFGRFTWRREPEPTKAPGEWFESDDFASDEFDGFDIEDDPRDR